MDYIHSVQGATDVADPDGILADGDAGRIVTDADRSTDRPRCDVHPGDDTELSVEDPQVVAPPDQPIDAPADPERPAGRQQRRPIELPEPASITSDAHSLRPVVPSRSILSPVSDWSRAPVRGSIWTSVPSLSATQIASSRAKLHVTIPGGGGRTRNGVASAVPGCTL